MILVSICTSSPTILLCVLKLQAAIPLPLSKRRDTTPTPKDGFHFDCRLLLSCLRNTSGPLRLLLDENGLLILEANQCRYFVCPRGPVRIVKKEVEKAVKTPRAKKSKNKTQTTTKAA